MSLPSKVNKENFRLLDLSSDEESEDLQLEIIPSRKKKVTRRERNRNPTAKAPEPNLGAEVQCAIKWAIRGTLLLWLLMLTWICAELYDQISSMKMDVDSKLRTSSNSVNDALQVCHTATREMRANVSYLSARLDKLEIDHQEFAKRVEHVEKELAAVTGQLSAAPELREMPKRLNDLQRTVAELGSQINGFDTTISMTHKQAVTATSSVEDVKTLLHNLEVRTNETIANVSANAKRDDDIRQQVSAVNNTLDSKVEALRIRIEELTKTTSTVAPSTAAPAPLAPASAPPATPAPVVPVAPTAAPSAAPAPGIPAKPSVLQ